MNHRHTQHFKEQLRKGWIKRKAKCLGTAWNKGMKGLHLSPDTEFVSGFKHSEATKAKMRLRRGPKSSNWKGGATSRNTLFRSTNAYKQWRISVFQRDDFTCQECGIRGVSFHAHHIKPFSIFPELRLKLNNGLTLCVTCHKKTPTYLNGMLKQSTY